MVGTGCPLREMTLHDGRAQGAEPGLGLGQVLGVGGGILSDALEAGDFTCEEWRLRGVSLRARLDGAQV